jgi:predicted acetyltransferase
MRVETVKLRVNQYSILEIGIRCIKWYKAAELCDKEMLHEYIREHYDNGENSISASMGLPISEYAEWVEKIKRNALYGDGTWGKSLLYLCLNGGKLIGLLSIRYELPKDLSEKYGHIAME